jgi:spore germination protein
MLIYIVQPGDTIDSISQRYGVSVAKLIQDNELINPYRLVPGQTILIVSPEQIYIVQEGDTLSSIATAHGITLMQLLRNNPFLSNRDYIYPGETLVISYNNTQGKITTIGFTYPYIKEETLRKTLPFLTYLSVFNYRATRAGDIITVDDDSKISQIAIEYGVAPLLMIATISTQGVPDLESAYDILLNEEYQENHIDLLLEMITLKGYSGANIVFSYLNETNQRFYQNFLTRISERFRREGYLLFVTVNPNFASVDNDGSFEKVEYSGFSQAVENIIYLQFVWGAQTGPPAPISSISNIRTFMDYVLTMVPPDNVILGQPMNGYDWALPYVPGKTEAHSLTPNAILSLAIDVEATIQYDEASQTPYFTYELGFGSPVQHIVWFINAVSIDALVKLISEYGLDGAGIWNIMIYNSQLWLLINSQYEIVKMLPENIR